MCNIAISANNLLKKIYTYETHERCTIKTEIEHKQGEGDKRVRWIARWLVMEFL